MKKKTYDIYDTKLIKDTWRNVTRPRFNRAVKITEEPSPERVTRDDGTTVLAVVPPTERQLRERYAFALEQETGEEREKNLDCPSAITCVRLKLAMQLADLRAAAPRDRPAGGDQTPKVWDPDGEALADLDKPISGVHVPNLFGSEDCGPVPADPIAASRKRGAK